MFGLCVLTAFNTVREEKPMSHPSQLEILQIKRDQLKARLVEIGDMRPGSLVERFRKCGKPTCHCAEKDAPGHVGSVDPAVPGEGSPGDFFAVQSDDEVFRKQMADLKKFGFSEHFLHIFETLHAQGIPYVRFDGDGGEAEPQLEFANLPARRENIPVETTTELERVMRQIMGPPLKPEERVTICMDLINFTGEMCLTDDPLRLVDRSRKPIRSRPVTLDRNGFLKATLRALQTAPIFT